MNWNRFVLVLIAGLLCSVGATVAQDSALGSSEIRAEIVVELPDGLQSYVGVSPGSQLLELDLPRGSVYPLDFRSASKGLLRDAEVTPQDDDRVRLELMLAFGLLDQVRYEPRRVILTFVSRNDMNVDTGDAEDRYLLGAGDRVRVIVQNQPELTRSVTVKPEGTITAPLVGEVEAIGVSPRMLANHVANLLGRNFLVNPQVDIEVEEYNSQWVMISGEVAIPGRKALKGGTRLKEVISEAGGFTDTAGERVTISRRIEGSDEYETVRVDRGRFEIGLSDPLLVKGDIIDVPRLQYCYVQGEVRSPSRVPIEREMTLLKAVTLVGGLTDWADRKEVRILYGKDHEPSERIVNLKRIIEGKDADPSLVGGEIIVVKRRYF